MDLFERLGGGKCLLLANGSSRGRDALLESIGGGGGKAKRLRRKSTGDGRGRGRSGGLRELAGDGAGEGGGAAAHQHPLERRVLSGRKRRGGGRPLRAEVRGGRGAAVAERGVQLRLRGGCGDGVDGGGDGGGDELEGGAWGGGEEAGALPNKRWGKAMRTAAVEGSGDGIPAAVGSAHDESKYRYSAKNGGDLCEKERKTFKWRHFSAGVVKKSENQNPIIESNDKACVLAEICIFLVLLVL